MPYSMVSDTNDMALRSLDSTSAPRMVGITGNVRITSGGYILRGTKMAGDVLTSPRPGEQWMLVKSVNDIPLATPGYVALRIDPKVYCTLTVFADPPLPPTVQKVTSVWLKPVYSDGTTGKEEEYILRD